MSIIVKRLAATNEKVDLRDPQATIPYIAFRDTDEAAIRAAVLAAAPATYYGLAKTTCDATEQGGGVWLANVQYKLLTGYGQEIPDQSSASTSGAPTSPPTVPGDNDPLDESYAFSVDNGTQHITQSIVTMAKYGRGFNAPPDFKGAIGVDKGRINGCDRPAAALKFQMTKQIPTVSLAYIRTLRNLVGTVNNAPFYGRQAGEVLFLGANGQVSGTPDAGGWTVTFGFEEAENYPAGDPRCVIVPDSVVGAGDGLKLDAGKDGWDYVWVYYEPQVSANQVAPIPLAAYVERIHQRADFSLLGIGA